MDERNKNSALNAMAEFAQRFTEGGGLNEIDAGLRPLASRAACSSHAGGPGEREP